jgi:multidrug resistance efflux pump
VLFKIDPVPFELEVKAAQANVNSLRAKLLTARGNELTYGEQLKGATGKKAATAAKLDLARLRVAQYKELSKTGAGNRFDLEQAEADVSNLSNELTSLVASESQAKAKLGAKTKEGEQDEVAQARALIAQAEAQLDDAKWKLSQTVYYAPANGTIINLQLRVGAVASQLVANPVMTFVEDEQWLLAIYSQNEVRRVKPGDEAEIALRMYPGRVLKCKVDSVVWATAQGQLPISGNLPNVPPMPEGRLAVKLMLDGKDQNTFMAAGARGQGAIYTDYVELLHVIRRVFLRVSTKLDWLILKLH